MNGGEIFWDTDILGNDFFFDGEINSSVLAMLVSEAY